MPFSSFVAYRRSSRLKWSGDTVLFLLSLAVLPASGRISYINDHNGKLTMSFVNIR